MKLLVLGFHNVVIYIDAVGIKKCPDAMPWA
jgi:hypothetical protein